MAAAVASRTTARVSAVRTSKTSTPSAGRVYHAAGRSSIRPCRAYYGGYYPAYRPRGPMLSPGLALMPLLAPLAWQAGRKFAQWIDESSARGPMTSGKRCGWSSGVNMRVYEHEDQYVLEADLPGVAKEDIHVDVVDDTLSVKAVRHYSRGAEKYDSEWEKHFWLPQDVDVDRISAKVSNGILSITLGRVKKSVKNVAVEGGHQDPVEEAFRKLEKEADQQANRDDRATEKGSS